MYRSLTGVYVEGNNKKPGGGGFNSLALFVLTYSLGDQVSKKRPDLDLDCS